VAHVTFTYRIPPLRYARLPLPLPFASPASSFITIVRHQALTPAPPLLHHDRDRHQPPISLLAVALPAATADHHTRQPTVHDSLSLASPDQPATPRSPDSQSQLLRLPNRWQFICQRLAATCQEQLESPSSTVRSTAATSPSVVPLDHHPDFDAFRKQSEGKAFNLAGLNNFKMAMPAPRPVNGKSNSSRKSSLQGQSRTTEAKDIPSSSHRVVLDKIDVAAAELSRSPKRVLSPGSATESNRKGSPPTFDHDNHSEGRHKSTPTSPEAHQRFRLPLDALNGSYASQKSRAETLPVTTESSDAQLMATTQHVLNLLASKPDEILLLDLRVATQYAVSHIAGALNLCIPTTLLKRPSFNVHKLADTFQDEEQRARFENWRNSTYIIVYDANSSVLKDATICMNTIKKFRGEGYDGTSYIIKGGFNEFAKTFPSYVEAGADHRGSGNDSSGPAVAPAVGGCPMPGTDKPANPFFGNIRQNMDLIGGVGQMQVKHPAKETKSAEDNYPEWLKEAAKESDMGKRVASKFEQIERREKKRMEDALSGRVSWGNTKSPATPSDSGVQIAGLEKGNKNRYNNIWPFEHSRVKLQNVPSNDCDYFNASYIQASWSKKRYISTQAPIPATFNDFWNVVWQQDVRVIVMLTAEKEGAQVKAHNYWDARQYGPLHLEFLSEKRASIEPYRIHRHQKRPQSTKRSSTHSQIPQVPLATIDSREDKSSEQPYVIVRKFTLRNEKFPFQPMREITQLQYSSWPDFGAPAHPAHLLGLVEQCDAVVRATNRFQGSDSESEISRPVMVHCSAGCGRTGTFCTVDTVIDMLKKQKISRESPPPVPEPVRSQSSQDQGNFFDYSKEDGWLDRDDQDLVEKTVEDFRHQRISMVQSLRQYVLCYESVMEWLVEQREFAKET